MSDAFAEVVLLERRIQPGELRRLVERFEDMVKYVVDVERGLIAIGGEMHVDGEQLLLVRQPTSRSVGRQLLPWARPG